MGNDTDLKNSKGKKSLVDNEDSRCGIITPCTKMKSSDRKSVKFSIIYALFFVICLALGSLSYVNKTSFVLTPNSDGKYPSKISQLVDSLKIKKAEARICPIGQCRPDCLCDAFDGMGGTPGVCGPSDYSCDQGYVGGETGTSWICYSPDGGDDAFCAKSDINGACGSTHWSCTAGTEFPAARYTGPDGYQWRCDGTGSGASATCNEYLPKITISASPSDVPYYDYTYLTWSTQYANSCTVKLDGGTWQVTGVSGSGVSYGRLIGDNSWTATCTGSAGSKTSTVAIRTKPQVTITAGSTSVPAGNPVTISWSSVFTSQVSCSVTKNGAAWTSSTNNNLASNGSPFAATNNSAEDKPTSNTTYVATCTTPSGASQSASVSVTTVGQVGSCGGTSMSCAVGTPTALSLSGGTHYWYCTGPNGGGTSPTCSASAPQNAVCGATHWGCSVGTNSPTNLNSFNGEVYGWKCAGLNGGTGTSCYEYVPIAGVCGSSLNSCDTGTFADTADDATYSRWQCNGKNGGANVSCQIAKVNGQCNLTPDVLNSCTAGIFQDNTDSADYVQWYCNGSNGGTNMGCAKQIMKGTCGSSVNTCQRCPITNGLTSCTSDGLVDIADDASAYKWQCTGANSGPTANCSISKPPVVSVSMQTANGGTSGRAYVGESVKVNWTATNNPTGCSIYRNGSLETTVGGAVTTYTTPGIPEGNTNYRVDCNSAGGTGTGNTVTFIVPTSPSGLSASCPQPGTSGNFSWTLPSGYTGSYFRYCKGTSCDYTAACNPAKNPPEGSCVNGTYSSISQATTPNSTYAWYIHTMDQYGNWSNGVNGSNIYCTPAVPGVATISNPTPANIGVGMSANFTISGTDSAGMNVRYQVDADNNGTADVTTSFGASGWSYTWTNSWGGAGSKTFQVRTETSDGRLSSWASKTINVIAQPSATLDISSEVYGSNTISDYGGSVTVSWQGYNSSACSVTKNGSAWQSGISGSVDSGALPADTTFAITCSNTAGQTFVDSVGVSILPDIILAVSPQTPSLKCGDNPTVSWTSNYTSNCTVKRGSTVIGTGATNAGVKFGPISDYYFSVDWACTSATGYPHSGSYGGGNFKTNGICGATNNTCNAGTFQDATDDASYSKWTCLGGCTGVNADCSLNKPAPVAPTISGPTTVMVSSSDNFTITATDSLGSQVKYEVDWDNNGTTDQTSALGASGWTYTVPNNWAGAGSKTFKARAITSDGRISAWASYTVTAYVQCAPTITMTGLKSNTQVNSVYWQGAIDYNKAANIAWGASDAKSGQVMKNSVVWRSTISGSETTGPLTSDVSFWNQCVNMSGGGTNNMTQLIKVYPGVFEPGAFVVTPPAFCGDTAKVSWNVQNAGKGCNVGFGGVWKGVGGASGSTVSDPIYSSTQVSLSCSSDSSSGQSTTTNVTAPARDGVCGATENTCTSGTAIPESEDSIEISWTCTGGCGGNMKSCSKTKPPLAPTITGPTDGAVSTSYNFNIAGTDPSGAQVKYGIDWDNDGTVDGTTALGASGWSYVWSNNWAGSGTKNFKAKTISSDGRESNWSTVYAITIHGAPINSITAATTTVAYNTGTAISWTSTDATSCSVKKNGTAWQSGLTGSNIATGNLTADTTFDLTCTNLAGNTVKTVVVKVKPSVTISVTAASIAYNASTTVSWSSLNAASCSIKKAGSAWQTSLSSVGTNSGPLTTNTIFLIDCSSSGGLSSQAQTTVTVSALNGSCKATHYACNSGTSANNINGAMKWTWNCNGANGGTNATCEETKTAPSVPTITGATEGKINTNYTFVITATNPSGDPIRYALDWDNNGTVDGYLPITGTTTSGTSLNWTNQWAGSGLKTFKVRTETNGGPVSGWATYNITMYGLPTVSWTPTTTVMAYGTRTIFSFTSTDSSYCNIYSTKTSDPNTYEAAPFWSNASTTFEWADAGPYYKNFKRKAVCYNPFGDYKSAEITVFVSQNDAACNNINIPYYLAPGEKFSPKVSIDNVGTNVWDNVSPFFHNAYVIETDWWSATSNRYLPLTNGPINQLDTGIFQGAFDILTAPMVEGLYAFGVQPVQTIEGGGEIFYGDICRPVTPHKDNKILVKAPTLGIGDGDVDIEAISFPLSYVVNDPAVQKNVTVRNRGGGTIIGSISIPDPKFTCVSGCNFTLGPGGTSSVTIAFQSTATGTFATTMVANSDAGNKNVTLTAGTGAKFEIKYSPLNFGAIALGKSAYLNLKIKNNSLGQGSGPFGFNPTVPFSCVSGCVSGEINPNTERVIRIKFTPATTTPVVQNINIPTVPSIPIVLMGQGIKPVFKVEEK